MSLYLLEAYQSENKKMAAGFLRIPPHRGLCWDENSKDLRKTLNENSALIANLRLWIAKT
jgi:hypothetical protein